MKIQALTRQNKLTYAPKLAGILMGCVLVGCASKPTYNSKTGKHTTITQHKIITNSRGVPNLYQVKQGDTVSKISQRYGLEWREVARLNNLDRNHTIYTGQWLTLWTGNSKNAGNVDRAQSRQAPPPAPKKNDSVQLTKNSEPIKTSGSTSTEVPFSTGSVGVMQFKYPVGNSNPVVRRFGTATVKGSTVTSNGMWFSGRDGDAVSASRAGTVIHADNNHAKEPTISIQHTDGFVSSYIYIKDAQVRAGDSVRAGQRIASMKVQAGNTAIFEFRISRNNVYVDPLTVLK